MSKTGITPDKITKPFQMLATWLASLIATNSAFLFSASSITSPEWAAGALVIASIVNVPIHLVALFILQTKFRPQLQDDKYFSKYLEQEQFKNLSLEIDGKQLSLIKKAIENSEKYLEVSNND